MRISATAIDLRYLRYIVLSIVFVSFVFVWHNDASLQTNEMAKTLKGGGTATNVRTSKIGSSHVNFDDEREIALGENAVATQPLLLVSADLDSDGFADVVTVDGSGSLQMLKGVDPANFAFDPLKSEELDPEPFSAVSTGGSLGITPDFLFAGDFNADGKQDILGGAKGASTLVVVIGDGQGHFSEPVNIEVGGTISSTGSGEIGKPDGQADLAVSYTNSDGSFLAIYEHPESAFKHAPEIIKLPSPANTIVIGNTDEDLYSDIAAACGDELVIVHERGQAYPWDIVKNSGIIRPPAVVETREMPFSIVSIAVGHFGEKRGTSLALLGGDGNIYNLEPAKAADSPAAKVSAKLRSDLNRAPFVPAENNGRSMAVFTSDRKEKAGVDQFGLPVGDISDRKDRDQILADPISNDPVPKFDLDAINRQNAADAPRKAAMQQRTKDAFIRSISAKTTSVSRWPIKQISTDHRYAAIAATGAKLTRASVSDSRFDDLVITSPTSGQLEITLRPRGEKGKTVVEDTVVEGSGGIIGILPMRLNLDGLSDLIVLRQGARAPSVILTAPSANFSVNTTADDGDCNFGGSCSLRDAIRRANQIGGSSTIYFNISDTPSVISPITPLPALIQPITIQGSHQANGTKLVEISGENMGGPVDGLKIRTSNAFIYDLAITGFKSQTINGSQVGGNGIAIESDSARPNNHSNNVLNCFLGIDVTGTTAKGNTATGILIFDSDENEITNTVSSGNNTGIAIEGGNTNSIYGSILGLNSVGTEKVHNYKGIFLGGADNRVGSDFAGAPNTISGNGVVSNIAPCVGYGIYVPIFVDLTTQELLSHDNNIVGNKIGTDPSGGVGLGNCWQGIQAEPLTGTTIGSITESGRNIISDNGLGGVWCVAEGNANTTEGGFCSIMGNNVGTDISGNYSIPNNIRNITQVSGSTGAVMVATNISVSAVGAPGGTTQGGSCTGLCNLVSGNSTGFDNDAAIVVGGPGNAGVFNNYVGTKRNGAQVLENGRSGIALFSTTLADASPEYFAGGYTEFDGSLGNLVSGNNNTGIEVGYVGGFDGPGTYHVLGNLIGTDVSGQMAIPNGSGVFIGTRFTNPVDIGDSNPLGSNVIAGNAFNGINIFTGFGVKIIGNAIGVNSNQAPLGNGGTGVNIGGYYAFSTTVGGTDSTTTNIIANNSKSGVKVNGITSTFHSIRGNAIYNNGQLGIDLNQSGYFPDGDGVTLNDDCSKDADLGANRLQNYPVLFAPIYNPDGTVHVTGTLISEPLHHYRIDVYSNLVADPSGHGEARSFLGTADVTVDGNGFGSIDWNSLATAPNGAFISATATDDLGNTSEFSCTAGQACDGNAGYKDLAEYLVSGPVTCPASIVVNIDTDEPDVAGDQLCDVNTQNSGLQCSLRAALELVNNPSYVGPHEITFDIPGSGVHTITPASPLPVISKPAYIRATTQPGWTNSSGPMIEISGASQAAGGAFVLAAGSDGSQISGVTINRFVGDGITIESNSNSVELCYIGLNASGTDIERNRRMTNGISITGIDNQIGSTQLVSPNYLAGSLVNQILITGTNAKMNRVFGNWIGIFPDHETHVSSLTTGVRIDNFASQNIIGGEATSQQNSISGQGHSAIEIFEGAHDNKVYANVIAYNQYGISVIRSASNKIGLPGDSALVRIRNNSAGVLFSDDDPALAPVATVDRFLSGKEIVDRYKKRKPEGATATTYLTHDNQIQASLIGGFQSSDANGTGIIVDKATKTTIGKFGDAPGAGSQINLIFNNTTEGIFLTHKSEDNTLRANRIGLDTDGITPHPNNNGILLSGNNNIVRNNFISGNTDCGIKFEAQSETVVPSGNKIYSNIIGSDSSGMVRGANGRAGILLEGNENDIGFGGHGNFISGNYKPGDELSSGIEVGVLTFNNRITGNRIGINFDESGSLGNKVGVLIYGFFTTLKDNVISGNSIGVVISRHPEDDGTPPRKNALMHNWIGTDGTGENVIRNTVYGIEIINGVFQTTIGGKNPGEGNVISGNGDTGIYIATQLSAGTLAPTLTEVLGNYIGTNGDGTRALPNEKAGIVIGNSHDNTIGGSGQDIPGARNIISGNGFSGIAIIGSDSYSNFVKGNYIGVGADGSPVGNTGSGVFIGFGAHNNTIGGQDPNAGNRIENNGRNGVALAPDAGAGNNIDPNSITGNAMFGITLNEIAAEDDPGAPPPKPVQNDELDFDTGANNLQNYPDIANFAINGDGHLVVTYKVDSSPGNSNYGSSEGLRVEFFKADASGQGAKFLNSNQFTFDDFVSGVNKTVDLGDASSMGFFPGDLITATVTDVSGNTSEFSPTATSGTPTPTPTATITETPTPTPTATATPLPLRSRADFDGDGNTDLSVFRPAEAMWYLQRSRDGLVHEKFGLSGDVPVPGDFDNDGKTDIVVFRPNPDNLTPDYYLLNSSTSTISYCVWGNPGDIPIAGDFDGDGKSDFALYRSTDNIWYVLRSTGGFVNSAFGVSGDIAVGMDYDGDSKTNLTVFRPSSGTWYIARPSGNPAQNFDAVVFGQAGDIPVPADYDGDNKEDIAVFRPSTGTWWIKGSASGVMVKKFGLNGDLPVPGDYDGDGKDDIGVFRNGVWFIDRSTQGLFQQAFGIGTDIPIPNKYLP